MAKILNIDALKKEERIITLGGVSYPMKEISVSAFLELNELIAKSNEAITQSKDPNAATLENIKFLVQSALISFPTCPIEALNDLSIPELKAINDFAMDGSLPDGLKFDENGNVVSDESQSEVEEVELSAATKGGKKK